ncbi:MAG: hypothetical protein HQK54_09305 [Oligoflexales bacterium]|nr:hypothetical protein [Oligoflexales bacterium]
MSYKTFGQRIFELLHRLKMTLEELYAGKIVVDGKSTCSLPRGTAKRITDYVSSYHAFLTLKDIILLAKFFGFNLIQALHFILHHLFEAHVYEIFKRLCSEERRIVEVGSFYTMLHRAAEKPALFKALDDKIYTRIVSFTPDFKKIYELIEENLDSMASKLGYSENGFFDLVKSMLLKRLYLYDMTDIQVDNFIQEWRNNIPNDAFRKGVIEVHWDQYANVNKTDEEIYSEILCHVKNEIKRQFHLYLAGKAIFTMKEDQSLSWDLVEKKLLQAGKRRDNLIAGIEGGDVFLNNYKKCNSFHLTS